MRRCPISSRFPTYSPAAAALITALAVSTFHQYAAAASEVRYRLASPNGEAAVTFGLHNPGEQDGSISYSVTYRGQEIIADSPLGLVIQDGVSLDNGFVEAKIATSAPHDGTWKPVYGERSEIRDRYRQMQVDLTHGTKPSRHLRIMFRAYDEGIALCYTIPQQPEIGRFTIAAENTQFRFTGNHPCWPVYSAQGVYQQMGIDQVKPNCERPLVVEVSGRTGFQARPEPSIRRMDGLGRPSYTTTTIFAAIAEARLVDYARMRLEPVPGAAHALKSMLASEVVANAPYTTPWRVIMLADSPGQLLQRNSLILNLNDPCAIADTSWIKPGKVIREVTLTTEGGKACIDFAVQRGLQYVEYDAGWYGSESDEASNARQANRDPNKSRFKGPLDLQEVIRYGRKRGIGILLYVNRRALERQLDEILPLYEKWGVKGVKYGFVQVGSQQWTAWLHEAVRKAAAHRLMVDIHDEYRPTGYERTYPNLMTQEGIRGNETMPPAEHNVILPFTRLLCGPGDYTVCWYSDRIQISHAHQLACPVVLYSPWQFLYWYDRPELYQGEPELDFFKHVPTVWDETRVIQGQIGRYITVARRSGREWYVGTMNAAERRTLEIRLSFLEPGVKYTARIHGDAAPDGARPRDVSIEERPVDSHTVLIADLARQGGQAIRIVPAGGVLRAAADLLQAEGRIEDDARTASDAPAVAAVVGSGFLGLNPALVTVEVIPQDGNRVAVNVTGVAKEGLIKQHAGEKAAKRIAGRLQGMLPQAAESHDG